MEVSKYIAHKIKYFRKERGLTQKELGDLVGVRDNTISGYENNINDPGNDMLFNLAHALRISINDLFPETTVDSSLSPSEREHIEKYRALTDEHKEDIDVQLNHLYEKDRADRVKKESPSSGQGEADAG